MTHDRNWGLRSSNKARTLCVAAAIFFVACQTAAADAVAFSDLLLLDFHFALANGAESVTPGPPATFCDSIGSGYCGPEGIQTNLSLGETFGPTPVGKDLAIHFFDLAFAASPPADFSEYVSGVTGFFDFKNYSDNFVVIDLTWNATYELSAMGNQSTASISASYRETEVSSGILLVPNAALFSDFQPNDGNTKAVPHGTIFVNILPNSTTSLRIEDPLSAEAESIREPGTLGPCGLIIGGGMLWLYSVRRRRVHMP